MKLRDEFINPPELPADADCGYVAGTEVHYFLSFRLKTGQCRAYLYSDVRRMDFDGEEGIRLRTEGETVAILGKDLGELYVLLSERRVREIRESDFGTRTALFEAVPPGVVRQIQWE